MLAERLGELNHRGHALSDRDIDRNDAAVAVVDDRVERDRRLARLTVPDDQLPLATANRGHRVDRLDPGLERLFHWLAVDDAGREAHRDLVEEHHPRS